MDEDWYRKVNARSAAHAALISTLLRWQFKDLTPDKAKEIGAAMKKQARDPSPFIGKTKDDEAASERLADMVVQMHTYIDSLVDDAVEAVEKLAKSQ